MSCRPPPSIATQRAWPRRGRTEVSWRTATVDNGVRRSELKLRASVRGRWGDHPLESECVWPRHCLQALASHISPVSSV